MDLLTSIIEKIGKRTGKINKAKKMEQTPPRKETTAHSNFEELAKQARQTDGKHHVYVVLLDDQVKRKYRHMLGTNPQLPAVYVGLTGHSPAKRFKNHKENNKAGRGYVRDFGIELLPEYYQEFNPMPYHLAKEFEPALAEHLRSQGFTVFGGH